MASFEPRVCAICGKPETTTNRIVEIPGRLVAFLVHESCVLESEVD